MAGFFITLEGVEGAGKSTQAGLLTDCLQAKGLTVLRTREPGGTPLAEAIRRLLLGPTHVGMEPLAELYLVLAARADHVSRVVLPALKRGEVVVMDRFADATLAYQGGGRGLPADLVRELSAPAACHLVPHLTFLLDLAPSEGLARIRGRSRSAGGRRKDRLEEEELAFHERVRAAYLELARRDPQRVVVLAGDRSREDLHQEICHEAAARLGRTLEPAGN